MVYMNHYNCIYMYTNKVNGKKYIGQTKDFNQRHQQHIYESLNTKRKHSKTAFHSAIRKYGIENFEIKILAENIPTQEKMDEYEIFFIKRNKTFYNSGNGYNLAEGGYGGNHMAGKTEEEIDKWKENLSKVFSGENNPMYGRKGENNPNYGRKRTEYELQKTSEALKGDKNPAKRKEIREKISKSMTGLNNHGCKSIVAINNKTKNIYYFDYIVQCCESLEEIEGLKFDNSTITKICKYNNNPEEYRKTHNPKNIHKSHKGYTFYYKEDYERLFK